MIDHCDVYFASMPKLFSLTLPSGSSSGRASPLAPSDCVGIFFLTFRHLQAPTQSLAKSTESLDATIMYVGDYRSYLIITAHMLLLLLRSPPKPHPCQAMLPLRLTQRIQLRTCLLCHSTRVSESARRLRFWSRFVARFPVVFVDM